MHHPNIWKPFTILKDAPDPLRIEEGEGIWLTLEDGRRIIDCISSWWVTLHGHSQPEIGEAIYRQSQKLEHVIFANYSHRPAEELAERLTARLPGDLSRVFYSDNGSTAVEVALKTAWQYWKNIEKPRTRFIAFEGAYHGDTIGAMSVSSRSVFSEVFSELLFDVDFVPYPDTWLGDTTAEEREERVLNQLAEMLDSEPETYAGVIIEPLVQGTAGMRMCTPRFLKSLERLVRERDNLLIYDEVMTGFGRTGDWFASTRSGTEPDIICLSKGITGGFLPLSVTVCSSRIYDAFNSSDPMHTLWHGHSYTANPLGCAAALASFKLLEQDENAFLKLEEIHLREVAKLAETVEIERPRVTGTVAAFTLPVSGEGGYLNQVADRIKAVCTDYGLLLRPLGNEVYLMPPFCITEEELSDVYRQLAKLLTDLNMK